MCVRYRYDDETSERIKTVELIVDRDSLPTRRDVGLLRGGGDRHPPRHRSRHVAPHGLYDEKYPLDSALLLSKDGGSADRFLEARDIAATRIRAQLVAFGACESGRGEIERGQGLVGMTWAALRGGAASAAAMRWRVDDHATARLFASFYGNLDRGERQADALRHAGRAPPFDRSPISAARFLDPPSAGE